MWPTEQVHLAGSLGLLPMSGKMDLKHTTQTSDISIQNCLGPLFRQFEWPEWSVWEYSPHWSSHLCQDGHLQAWSAQEQRVCSLTSAPFWCTPFWATTEVSQWAPSDHYQSVLSVQKGTKRQNNIFRHCSFKYEIQTIILNKCSSYCK